MEEKNKVEKSTREKPSRQEILRTMIIVLSVVLVLAVMLLVALLGRENSAQPAETQPQATTEPAIDAGTVALETAHGTVLIDAACADTLRYTQTTEGDVITEVYSMMLDSQEREVFRVCLGDAAVGDLIGYLMNDQTATPVTVAVKSYAETDFPDEETFTVYQGLMDQLNVVLIPIRTAENFAEDPEKPEATVKLQDNQMTYWTVALPADMRCQESTEGDQYKADFYGMINGEEYRLYTITLGGEVAKPLGAYMVDGEGKALGVTIHSADSQMPYMEDGTMETYGTMMETVNDVLRVIESSPNYIE